MDFSNRNLWSFFRVGDTQIYITQSLLDTWIVMAALIAFAIFVRIKIRSFKQVPSGFQNFIESIIDAIDNLVKSMMGSGFEHFGGIFLSMFAFILVSNYTAMLAMRPPTSDLATTTALALSAVCMMHILGIKRRGRHYFKEYFEPAWPFFPLHLMEELAKPISLSFRLFGNILGGVIIFELLYDLFPIWLKFGVPSIFHAYFDVFVGALQAFIFTVLSMTFIKQKSSVE
jgi:F-type H+-transporting ATPase subunit a